MIVPFAPGGATDAIARILNESLSQSLGQQVVIETVGGAGGMIGSARVARAAPDGYTLLLHQVGLAAGMTLYPNPTFDAEKDLTGVGLVNNSASVIAGRPDLPPNSMKELMAWMKEPGRIAKVAHAGVGAFGHLCGVLFVQEVGAKADQIPYRGGGPALNDLVAGHADVSCLSAAIVSELPRPANSRPMASSTRTASPACPASDSWPRTAIRPDLEFWHILFAPTGTPRPIIDKLNAALRHALADQKVLDAFAKNGMDTYPADQETPEIATAKLKTEIKRWGDVIRANHIPAQ